ncbi:Pax-6 protein [Striga asiatica]|uniref:Pax-6 protein n=1 Tax=Striga asiatica TaxID=4170 RepID=A0A5A7QA28_STRAF|nr:Pax-6 protein [Striga asiatica]
MLRSCKLAGKSNNGGGKVRATGTGEGRLTEPSQSRSMLWRSNPMLRRHRRATATVGAAITFRPSLPPPTTSGQIAVLVDSFVDLASRSISRDLASAPTIYCNYQNPAPPHSAASVHCATPPLIAIGWCGR